MSAGGDFREDRLQSLHASAHISLRDAGDVTKPVQAFHNALMFL